MKHLGTLLACFILFGFTASAQENKDASGDAEIKFDFTLYDFGKLTAGDDASVDFNFVNTGKTDLILSNVKASCGCTTPNWSKEPVGSGEEGVVTAKYNTIGRNGVFNKTIRVWTNASDDPVVLTIKGEVLPKPSNDGVPKPSESILNQF